MLRCNFFFISEIAVVFVFIYFFQPFDNLAHERMELICKIFVWEALFFLLNSRSRAISPSVCYTFMVSYPFGAVKLTLFFPFCYTSLCISSDVYRRRKAVEHCEGKFFRF